MNDTMMKHKFHFFTFLSVLVGTTVLLPYRTSVHAGESEGTIVGKVLYSGQVQSPKKLAITKDVKICGKVEHFDESLLISKDKGLANVIVSLSKAENGKGMDSWGTEFELNQISCVFVPHIVLVPVGAVLKINNSDGILHNIHTFSEVNQPVNKAQPRFLKVLKLTFDKPEIVRVACDVHNWMNGYIAVVDHPYYSVTDENGSFQITDIPAGEYTLEFWHESQGKQTQKITVRDGETTDIKVEF